MLVYKQTKLVFRKKDNYKQFKNVGKIQKVGKKKITINIYQKSQQTVDFVCD